MSNPIDTFSEISNAFCATGTGGGVDPTCSTMPKGDKGEKVGRGSKTAAIESATKEMERLKKIKGGVTPRHLTTLRKNLENMTVKQLNGFKKTNGVKASGKKADLVKKLESRLLDKLNKKKSGKSPEGQITSDDFDKALLSFSSNLLSENAEDDTARIRLIAEILAELIDDPKEEELDELIGD